MKICSPIFHSILYLYLHIDKEHVINAIEENILKGNTLLIDHPKYSLYIAKNRARWTLESQDEFYELTPFSIPLGCQKKLFTRRVVNELKVKLHRVIKENDQLRAHQYLNYLFRQKITQAFNGLKLDSNHTALWKNQTLTHLNNIDSAFCERYKFNASITTEKKFLALFNVDVTFQYFPCGGVGETHQFSIQGNYWTIKEKVEDYLKTCLFIK